MALFTPEARAGANIASRVGRQMEVLKSIDSRVKEIGKKWFRDPNDLVQPSDLLPNFGQEDFREKVAALQKRTAGLSRGGLVALVGSAVTEEGLFLFENRLMSIDAMRDEDGTSQGGFATGLRYWGAEENRHKTWFGLLVMLIGRVDMKAYYRTIQFFHRNGFNPYLVAPFDGVFYPYQQELATVISHQNLADLAEKEGATDVAETCSTTATEEGRHAGFYGQTGVEIIKEDAEEAVITLAERAKRTVIMPGAKMDEGDLSPDVVESDLFSRYAAVDQRLGIYGAKDYYAIVRTTVRKFGIDKLPLSGEAAKAQEFLCTKFTEERGERLNNILTDRAKKKYPNPTFSWIYDQPVFTEQAA